MSLASHIRVSTILFRFFIQYSSLKFKAKKYFQNTDTYPSHHKSIFNLKDENFITQAKPSLTIHHSEEYILWRNWKGFDYASAHSLLFDIREFTFWKCKNRVRIFFCKFAVCTLQKVKIENSGTCWGFWALMRLLFKGEITGMKLGIYF